MTYEYTYPVRGVDNHDPLYLTQVQVSIDSVFLLFTCIIGILIAVGRSRSKGSSNGKPQNRTLYFLFPSMFLIGVTTAFTISSGSLILADAYVGLKYQMLKGVFAIFYYPGEAFLIATIFSALSHCLGAVYVTPTVSSRRARATMILYRVSVALAFILPALLIFTQFRYAQSVMQAVNNDRTGTLPNYPDGWSITAFFYRGIILIIGFYFLALSVFLLRRARNQPSSSLKTASFVFLFIISPAIIIHGLFGTTMNGFLFKSLPFKLQSAEPDSWPDLISARVDPICFTVVFAGIGWILIKQEKPVTADICLTNTRDPENGTSGI